MWVLPWIRQEVVQGSDGHIDLHSESSTWPNTVDCSGCLVLASLISSFWRMAGTVSSHARFPQMAALMCSFVHLCWFCARASQSLYWSDWAHFLLVTPLHNPLQTKGATASPGLLLPLQFLLQPLKSHTPCFLRGPADNSSSVMRLCLPLPPLLFTLTGWLRAMLHCGLRLKLRREKEVFHNRQAWAEQDLLLRAYTTGRENHSDM